MEDANWDENNILLPFFKAELFINKRIIQYLSLLALLKAIKDAEVDDINKTLEALREVLFPWEKSLLFDKAEQALKRLDKFKNQPLIIKKVGK